MTCLVCGRPDPEPFIDAGQVPVQCTELYSDRDAAMSAPMGDLRLVLCPGCAAVTNAAFDAELVPYDGDYENSQMFSPTFLAYAEALATRLVEAHRPAGRGVVEVGCGKGEFLSLLADRGAVPALGYDPTYRGEVDGAAARHDLRIVREIFDETSVEAVPALVCLRHVLEHMAAPSATLEGIRRAVSEDPACVVYVEVPDADFTFTPSGLWDLIYQHCTYFSDVSLEHVAVGAGFEPFDISSVFGGQFLSMEARPAPGAECGDGYRERVDAVVERRRSFAEHHRGVVAGWTEQLRDWDLRERRVALWGAGAKGVTFLNVVGGSVSSVIDLNQRKHGSYLPGTGHRVDPPGVLTEQPPDVVIVMNPAYEAEIRSDLAQLGVTADVVAV